MSMVTKMVMTLTGGDCGDVVMMIIIAITTMVIVIVM